MHWINNVLFAAAVAAAAVGGGSAMAGEENKNMNDWPMASGLCFIRMPANRRLRST